MAAERLTVLAVDWSGAVEGQRRKIQLAEARAGRLRRIESGRTREELIEALVERARRDPRLVVGLDFAFSCPAWFLRRNGLSRAPDLWELVARRGESWLARCPRPFWGRPGHPRPPVDPARPEFRRSESERLPIAGIAPKSVFQIGGAGSVGTGSLRGIPHLSRLRAEGFAIVPFDPPRLPLAVEIYPRWFTGPVNKTSRLARHLYVAQHLDDQPPELARAAAASEDAFDAAVSAICMSDAAHEVVTAPPEPDPILRLEGSIWCPARDAFHPRSWPLRVARVPTERT